MCVCVCVCPPQRKALEHPSSPDSEEFHKQCAMKSWMLWSGELRWAVSMEPQGEERVREIKRRRGKSGEEEGGGGKKRKSVANASTCSLVFGRSQLSRPWLDHVDSQPASAPQTPGGASTLSLSLAATQKKKCVCGGVGGGVLTQTDGTKKLKF